MGSLYNHEYSRDIERCAAGSATTTTTSFCDFIRRYKGVELIEVIFGYSPNRPGDMTTLAAGQSRLRGRPGRNVPNATSIGYGRIGQLIIRPTQRHRRSEMANDAHWGSLSTDRPITSRTDPNDAFVHRLLEGPGLPDWEGFQYAVGNPAADGSKTAPVAVAQRMELGKDR